MISLFPNHDMFFFEPMTLWAQQGGGGELIGLIIFVLIIVFNAIKAMFEARFAANESKKQKEAIEKAEEAFESAASMESRPKSRRERPRTPRKRLSDYENATESPGTKTPLSRALGTQGEGARFEADPGTLDTSHLVGPSIEPTVKPTLESMTGIYEAAPTVSELGDQPLTLDIQRLIARPEGIRQAVILAEILKRPDF